MIAQIKALNALGEAYQAKAALAAEQGQSEISLHLLFHGFVHLEAAARLEADQRAELTAMYPPRPVAEQGDAN